jgi:hypothetical protein
MAAARWRFGSLDRRLQADALEGAGDVNELRRKGD